MKALDEHLHDIRKPLNNISMQAELIKMLSDNPVNNEKLQGAAQKIIASAKDCSAQLQALFEQLENTHTQISSYQDNEPQQ